MDYNDDELYNFRGWAYYFQEEYDKALEDFNKALQLNPNQAMSYSGRASVYRNQNKTEEAKTNFLSAGLKYLNQKKYTDARKNFNNAIKIDANYGESYFYLGQVENRQSNYQAAINEFDKAINLGFAEDYVYTNRGYCKYKLNHYYEAIKDFNEAIEIDITHASAYKWRGESYLNLNEYKNAETDFIKYLELEGENLDEKIKDEYLEKIKKCKNATGISSFEDVFENLKEVVAGLFDKLNELEIFGEVNKLLKVLIVTMIISYACIIIRSIHEGYLTVGNATSNLFIKIILLVVIVAANALDESEVIGVKIRNVTMSIIWTYELISTVENLELLGAPVPAWLKTILQSIKYGIRGVFDRIFGISRH